MIHDQSLKNPKHPRTLTPRTRLNDTREKFVHLNPESL
jgi:hypothetical protein